MSEKGGKTISKPLYPKIPVLSEATFQKSWLGPIRTPNVPECSDGPAVKVSKFQNEFMKSSFLPKYEPKIVKISALSTKNRNPDKYILQYKICSCK